MKPKKKWNSWGSGGHVQQKPNTLRLSTHTVSILSGHQSKPRDIVFGYPEAKEIDPEDVAREHGCRFLGDRFEFKIR